MSAEIPRRVLVVAGLIVDRDGRVLITQRRADQSLPLQWEFPGGKIEPGESPLAALRRELDEEIGIDVHIGKVWDVLHHTYSDLEVIMLVYRCTVPPGQTAKCLEVNDLTWCFPDELDRYDILAADRPLIDRLIGEGAPRTYDELVP